MATGPGNAAMQFNFQRTDKAPSRSRARRVGHYAMLLALVAMTGLAPIAPRPALAQNEQPAASSAAPAAPAAPAQSATQPATENAAASPAIATLPRDLSPWGMFMAADVIVKAVMIGLAFASVLTWTIWLAKGLELLMARRRMAQANAALMQAHSLADARKFIGSDNAAGVLVDAATAEIEMSAGLLDADGIKERIVSRLERLEAASARRMGRGTGLLATIGATAPFVGLFGTVWGIMNAFIGISRMQTTNLAVVAPGIAEALLATALGLVAAIPAVVIYNFFSRWIAGYRLLHADASAGVLRLASRDIDRALQKDSAPRRAVTAAE